VLRIGEPAERHAEPGEPREARVDQTVNAPGRRQRRTLAAAVSGSGKWWGEQPSMNEEEASPLVTIHTFRHHVPIAPGRRRAALARESQPQVGGDADD